MSGDRKGWYVKRATKCTIPGVVFAVVCRPAYQNIGARKRIVVASWHTAQVSVSYRRRGKWTAPEAARVSTPDALRDWMDERARPGRTNWVICPVASEVLTLSEWWSYAESNGIDWRGESVRGADAGDADSSARRVRIHQLCANGRTDIITYTHHGVRWRWVGAGNYWPDAGAGAAAAGAVGEGGGGDSTSDETPVGGAHVSDSCALAVRFCLLCDWWGRAARAPFGCTAGQLAWGILRSHIPERGLCAHRDEDAQRLERAASHGGRATVWYTRAILSGDENATCGADSGSDSNNQVVRGPITHVDVSSMYPTLLRDMRFPVKLRQRWAGVSGAFAQEMCEDFGVIARVHIRTSAGEFPLRRGESVLYPVGEFTTTLAGPDLIALRDCGEILRVHEMYTYDLGRPFEGAMSALLDARAKAKADRDKCAETFAKLVSVSLGGKLAQRQGAWTRRADMDEPGRWGEHHIVSTRTGTVVRTRYLAGACWAWDDSRVGAGPHTSAFAYLTAYGRQHMAGVRRALPTDAVVSQDTDGIYCTPSAVRRMTVSGMLAREGPGLLRITGSADTGQWWGPRHYRWGDKWVLAGYHSPVVSPAQSSVQHTYHTPLWQTRTHRAPDCVPVVFAESRFPAPQDGGRVQPDGWVLPPHIIQSPDDPEE